MIQKELMDLWPFATETSYQLHCGRYTAQPERREGTEASDGIALHPIAWSPVSASRRKRGRGRDRRQNFQ